MWQTNIWTNGEPIHWRLYVLLGLNDLKEMEGFTEASIEQQEDEFVNHDSNHTTVVLSCVMPMMGVLFPYFNYINNLALRTPTEYPKTEYPKTYCSQDAILL